MWWIPYLAGAGIGGVAGGIKSLIAGDEAGRIRRSNIKKHGGNVWAPLTHHYLTTETVQDPNAVSDVLEGMAQGTSLGTMYNGAKLLDKFAGAVPAAAENTAEAASTAAKSVPAAVPAAPPVGPVGDFQLNQTIARFDPNWAAQLLASLQNPARG